MDTVVCPSAAVENVYAFFIGIVEFLGIIRVITPPNVYIPNVNGVTSSRSRSLSYPLRTPPCMAAPTATA